MNSQKSGRVFFITAFLLPFLHCCFLKAQPSYTITTFTNSNGLPVNSITGMEYDTATELLWIGTQAGLVRFDGYSFQPFNIDSRLTPATRIATLIRSSGDSINCITEDFAVFRVRGSRPSFLATDTSVLLVGTLRQPGVKKAEQMIPAISKKENKELLPPWLVYTDAARSAFIFCFHQQVYYYDPKRNGLKLLAGTIQDFETFCKGNSLLLRLNNRLYQFDTVSSSLQAVAIENLPVHGSAAAYRIITNTNTEYPLLLHQDELWQLKYKDGKFTAVFICKGLPSFFETPIIRTFNNNNIIAIGDSYRGLYLLKRNSLKSIHTLSLTPKNLFVTYGQTELKPNTIINQEGIIINEKGEQEKSQPGLTPFNAYNRKDEMWYVNFDTLFCYNKKTSFIKPIVLKEINFWTVCAETAGKLYAITMNAIYQVEKDSALPLYHFNIANRKMGAGLKNVSATEFAPSLIAFAGFRYLWFFHTNTKAVDTIPITHKAEIRALWKYKDYLYMGTYGEGIFVYKNGVVKSLPLDKNGFLLYSHCFVPDEDGFCWISTNNGLFKVSVAAMCEANDKNLTAIYYHYFGKSDGIEVTELNGGCQTCALKLQNGTFSFPSMNGLVWVKPKEAIAQPPSGNIIIDQVQVDTAVYENGAKELSNIKATFKHISFSISIPCWANIENLYAFYRLRNFNDKWQKLDGQMQKAITYNGLPPGSYFLEIKVFNGFGTGQYKIISVPFTILQPWYLRWWSFVLAGLALLFFIRIIVNRQTAQVNTRNAILEKLVQQRTYEIEEKNSLLNAQVQKLEAYGEELTANNKIKNRLISIISHNIITPLQFIYRTSLALRKQRENLSPNMQDKTAKTITDTAKELELLAINILNWIRFQHQQHETHLQNFDVVTVINQVIDITTPLASEKALTLTKETEATLTVNQYRDALQVILYNLIANAIKYSDSGSVIITGQKKDQNIFLTVSDTGRGMSATKVAELLHTQPAATENNVFGQSGQGFGYLIIMDLLHLIRGQISIESQPDKGTSVTITFSDLDNTILL